MRGRIDSLPCVLCGRLLEQRADKNGKPYFVCDECGTQFFIRGTSGRERLAELFTRSRTATSKLSRQIFETELDHLQGYIELFYDDEQIIPPGSSEIEDAVPFAEWSRKVCDRVLDELDRCTNRT
jgi:hypothetical protein